MGGKGIHKVPLLAALQAHDIVHFAGHSYYDPDNPSRSGWRLHEGVLSAGELYLGRAYRLTRRYEEAIAAQRRALIRNPDLLSAHRASRETSGEIVSLVSQLESLRRNWLQQSHYIKTFGVTHRDPTVSRVATSL